jgi:diguanylate cyclase (GGDEF)-like protein/PAS domain S-box-containing protein/putative nucleotidyltransferase with HDIG domain
MSNGQISLKDEKDSAMVAKLEIKPIVVVIALLILAVLSGLYLRFAWLRYQNIAESEAIMLAQSLESILHPEHILRLDGSEEDLGTADYELIKISLIRLVETTNPIRFAYVMGKKDGNIVILMDSEPVDSADYSPPGQIYEEADAVLWDVFRSGKTVLTKPTTDRWGTWISGLVPIQDPNSGDVIAVFGIDYSASQWVADIWKQMIPDVVILLCLLLLTFAWFRSWAQKSVLKELSQKIAFDEALYHSVFDQTPIGIAIMNDMNYTNRAEFGDININPMVERILGRTSQDLENLTWPEITHPDDLQADLEQYAKFKTGEIFGYSMEKRFIKPDGSSVWTNMKISSLQGFASNKPMHICLLEDISSRKKAEEALIESERSKSVLISNLPGMAYRCYYDRDWTMEFVSDGCINLTGYYPESLINNKGVSFNTLISPEYREPLWREWGRSIAEKLPFKYEYEITTASGERKWVLEMGEAIYDDKGQVEALEGIILDISERKKFEEETKHLLSRTHSMINDHDAVMLLIEPETGEIIEANPAASTFYGYSKEELLNMTVREINAMDEKKAVEMRLKALDKGQKYSAIPHYLKNGEIRIVDVYICPINYDDRKVLFAIIFDVSEREEIAKANEFLAYHDYLTGLYNRRYFAEDFKRRSNNGDFPIALFLGDVDGFKTLNDTLGHLAGDKVLQEIAAKLSGLVSSGDMLARIGGDEFAILVSGQNELKITQYLNMLNNEFDRDSDLENNKFVTVSWGCGIQKDIGESLDHIYEEAEDFMNNRKLYNQKSIRSKTVDVIMETLFVKSEREKKHSERVGRLCESVARKMKLSKSEIDKVRVAGLLHDIGKITIDEMILNKPGKLDDHEWEMMKLHPSKSAEILIKTKEYIDIAEIVLFHHERFDGRGYPGGFSGDEIPKMARIVAICDAYDAMTEQRSYRKPFSNEEAIAELRRCSGTQFDPEIVDLFVNQILIKTNGFE